MLYNPKVRETGLLDPIFKWGEQFAGENSNGEFIDIPSLIILLHSMNEKIERLEEKVNILECCVDTEDYYE